MKKILMTIASAITLVFAGCNELPSEETMETTANAVGKAAAFVANQTKIDAKARAVVVEIMTEASKAAPTNGQSFAEAWTQVAKDEVDKLVKNGKLSEAQGAIVVTAFSVACEGLDYLITIRYPKAKGYANLVSAAARGFTKGFLSVFKVEPVKGVAAAPAEGEYDKQAYEYLKAKFGKSAK